MVAADVRGILVREMAEMSASLRRRLRVRGILKHPLSLSATKAGPKVSPFASDGRGLLRLLGLHPGELRHEGLVLRIFRVEGCRGLGQAQRVLNPLIVYQQVHVTKHDLRTVWTKRERLPKGKVCLALHALLILG